MERRMTAREPDPIEATRRCPWCTSTEQVEPATDHERDRTGMAWWARCCKRLFHGTLTEYQRIRSEVMANQAEAMTTRPTRPKETR